MISDCDHQHDCSRNQRKIAVYKQNLVECCSFCSYEAIVDPITFASLRVGCLSLVIQQFRTVFVVVVICGFLNQRFQGAEIRFHADFYSD